MIARQKRYGLGDAQIDAQNRAGDTFGQIVAGLTVARDTGSLTRDQIYNGMTQIQNAVNTYRAGYSGTDRGIAGGNYLQQLANQISLDWNREAAKLTDTAPSYVPAGPTGDINNTPQVAPYDPAIDYTINVGTGGGSASTPANIQISNTPGPPAGLPTPENVPAPDWLKSPLLWVAAGVGLLFLIKKGGNS